MKDLQSFNKEKWAVRYPHFKDDAPQAQVQVQAPRRPACGRRSMTFADDPQSTTEVMLKSKKGLGRSLILVNDQDISEELEKDNLNRGVWN